jgi:hypothetical protein
VNVVDNDQRRRRQLPLTKRDVKLYNEKHSHHHTTSQPGPDLLLVGDLGEILPISEAEYVTSVL